MIFISYLNDNVKLDDYDMLKFILLFSYKKKLNFIFATFRVYYKLLMNMFLKIRKVFKNENKNRCKR